MIVLLPNAYDMAAQSVCMAENVPPWCKWEVDELAVWKAPLWPSKWMIVVAAILLFLQGLVKFAGDVFILLGIEVDESAFGPIADGAEGKVDV
jgi:TRAP-type mannitol/chloroaromatic compound transport system permease small subunit